MAEAALYAASAAPIPAITEMMPFPCFAIHFPKPTIPENTGFANFLNFLCKVGNSVPILFTTLGICVAAPLIKPVPLCIRLRSGPFSSCDSSIPASASVSLNISTSPARLSSRMSAIRCAAPSAL